MNSFRLGTYQTIDNYGLNRYETGELNPILCIFWAGFSGIIGSSVGCPFYMVGFINYICFLSTHALLKALLFMKTFAGQNTDSGLGTMELFHVEFENYYFHLNRHNLTENSQWVNFISQHCST